MVEKYGEHEAAQISPFSSLVKVRSALSWPGSSIMLRFILCVRIVVTKTFTGALGFLGFDHTSPALLPRLTLLGALGIRVRLDEPLPCVIRS